MFGKDPFPFFRRIPHAGTRQILPMVSSIKIRNKVVSLCVRPAELNNGDFGTINAMPSPQNFFHFVPQPNSPPAKSFVFRKYGGKGRT